LIRSNTDRVIRLPARTHGIKAAPKVCGKFLSGSLMINTA